MDRISRIATMIFGVLVGFAFLISLLYFYLYFKKVYSYWKKRGVFYLEPSIPFGNFGNAITKASSGETMKKLYDQAQGQEFFGFWLFHRPAIMIRNPDLVKQILVKDFLHFHDRAVYLNKESDALSAHLFALKGKEWKRLRAKLTPTFTSGKMKMMFPSILGLSQKMVNYLIPFAGKAETVEMGEIVARFTTDVISSCAFGIDTDSILNPDTEFRKMGKKIFCPSFWSSLRIAVLFMLPKLARALKLRIIPKDVSDFFLTAVKDTIREREKSKLFRRDFMQLLIRLKNEGEVEDEEKPTQDSFKPDKIKLTVEEAAAQAFVFFMAGFETSSTTMAFALYELAKNCELQATLRREIEKTVADSKGITYDSVQAMPFLNMVVLETLRKYPPISSLNRECTQDYQIPGTEVTIEKGTLVVTSILGLHRDASFYDDPEDFRPERFSDEEKSGRNRFTYLPFGEGPRICIGLRFGLMQTKIGLIKLLLNYEFRLSKKSQIPMTFDPNSIVMTPQGGTWLQISFIKEEKTPSCISLLELLTLNKIREEDLDEVAEQMMRYDREEWEEEETTDPSIAERLGNGHSVSISAGYTDCMDEAIRFLIEEEKISPEHPVVVNLKAHLERSKERILKTTSELDLQNNNRTLFNVNIENHRQFFSAKDLQTFRDDHFYNNNIYQSSWNTG